MFRVSDLEQPPAVCGNLIRHNTTRRNEAVVKRHIFEISSSVHLAGLSRVWPFLNPRVLFLFVQMLMLEAFSLSM